MIRPSAALVLCGVAMSVAALGGCADNAPAPAEPTFYQDLAHSDAAVDAAAAASMISGYRSNNGLAAGRRRSRPDAARRRAGAQHGGA